MLQVVPQYEPVQFSDTMYLQDDVLLLYPFRAGTQFFGYNGASHTLTLEDDITLLNFHAASWANAARITTYLRPGVEQFHGAIFGTYKVQHK